MSKQEIQLICSAKKKSQHCKTACRHGKPHPKETERDSCHLHYEYCYLGGKIQKVICLPIRGKN